MDYGEYYESEFDDEPTEQMVEDIEEDTNYQHLCALIEHYR
jgi:hypothetical protein